MTTPTRNEALEEAARICEARVDGFKRVADERLYAGLQEEAAHWRTKLETAEEIASAIRAAAQSAPDGWRSMDSAPKDGSVLIVFDPDSSADERIKFVMWNDNYDDWQCLVDEDSVHRLTHWRPLPPAPTQSTP